MANSLEDFVKRYAKIKLQERNDNSGEIEMMKKDLLTEYYWIITVDEFGAMFIYNRYSPGSATSSLDEALKNEFEHQLTIDSEGYLKFYAYLVNI